MKNFFKKATELIKKPKEAEGPPREETVASVSAPIFSLNRKITQHIDTPTDQKMEQKPDSKRDPIQITFRKNSKSMENVPKN
jgi:hypothetical protein